MLDPKSTASQFPYNDHELCCMLAAAMRMGFTVAATRNCRCRGCRSAMIVALAVVAAAVAVAAQALMAAELFNFTDSNGADITVTRLKDAVDR